MHIPLPNPNINAKPFNGIHLDAFAPYLNTRLGTRVDFSMRKAETHHFHTIAGMSICTTDTAINFRIQEIMHYRSILNCIVIHDMHISSYYTIIYYPFV